MDSIEGNSSGIKMNEWMPVSINVLLFPNFPERNLYIYKVFADYI